MARVGNFSGPNFVFGAPLSIIHPKDNKFPLYEAALDRTHLTDEQKRELQDEIEELTGALILQQEWHGKQK